MTTQDFEYKIRMLDEDKGLVAVDLIGGVFVSNLNEFSDAFGLLESKRVRDLILNFKRLDFISSSGIGMLVELNARMNKIRARLWVTDVCPEVGNIFNQLSLDEIMRLLPTEQDALDRIAGDPPA